MIKCTSCGAEYEDYATYCNECNKPLASDEGESLEEKNAADNTKGIKQSIKTAVLIHKVLFWLYVVVFIGLGVLHISSTLHVWRAYFIVLIPLALASLHFVTYRGLNDKKKWARKVSIGIGMVLLFGFPIGTILGVVLLICMFRKGWEAELQ